MNTLRYFDFGAARPVLLLIARIAVVLIFIIFGFPKMMGFDGTVQYMASLGAPMPMLAMAETAPETTCAFCCNSADPVVAWIWDTEKPMT